MIKAKLLERIFDLVAPLIWFYNQGWWDTKKLKIKYFNQMLNHSFIWREQSILNKTEEKLSQISKFGKFRFCLTAFTVHSSSFHVPAWISTSQGKQYSTSSTVQIQTVWGKTGRYTKWITLIGKFTRYGTHGTGRTKNVQSIFLNFKMISFFTVLNNCYLLVIYL